MFNHFRTLLLNLPGDPAGPSFATPGDEAVAPGFRPVALPGALAAVRAVLFGTDPDRFYLNYRLRQYLAVVHASPLAGHALALDPRVTYRTDADDLVDPALYAPRAVPVAGPADARAAFVGAPAAPDGPGRSRHAFAVTLPGDGTASVERLTAPFQKTLLEPAFAGGLSDPLPLPGSGYALRVGPEAAQSWRAEVLLRPARSPGEVLADLGRLGETALDALLGRPGQRAEPYRTFRNLWDAARETPPRLAAAVAALAYRTEDARLGRA